jgi:hypothetical protein
MCSAAFNTSKVQNGWCGISFYAASPVLWYPSLALLCSTIPSSNKMIFHEALLPTTRASKPETEAGTSGTFSLHKLARFGKYRT